MPFYVRKSLRFGPIRFNLSNSGLGVSTGVKGFRVGTGPRGNYVHIGAGGLYYRASLSSPGKVSQPPAQLPPDRTDSHSVDAGVLMVDVDSRDAGQIVDSSSQALVEELRQKKRIEPLAPWFLGIVVGATLYAAYKGLQPGFVAAIAAAAIIGFVLLRRFDAYRKTTVIFYDFGDGTENTFRGIHDAFEALANVQRIWHIPSKGEVRDGKYHAGANELVRRTRIHVGFDAPPFVKTNIPTPSLSAGTQKLYFFPDKLLIFEKSSIGGVSAIGGGWRAAPSFPGVASDGARQFRFRHYTLSWGRAPDPDGLCHSRRRFRPRGCSIPAECGWRTKIIQKRRLIIHRAGLLA